MSSIVVRRARNKDMKAIAAMWSALVAYHKTLDPRLPPAATGGADNYAGRLADRLDDTLTRILVAEVEDHVVGYVLGMVVDLMGELFEQESCGFVADIYVDPDHRHMGVGRALVDALMVWFGQRDIRYYEWHVAAQNEEGQAFWRALGGETVLLRMRAELPEGKS